MKLLLLVGYGHLIALIDPCFGAKTWAFPIKTEVTWVLGLPLPRQIYTHNITGHHVSGIDLGNLSTFSVGIGDKRPLQTSQDLTARHALRHGSRHGDTILSIGTTFLELPPAGFARPRRRTGSRSRRRALGTLKPVSRIFKGPQIRSSMITSSGWRVEISVGPGAGREGKAGPKNPRVNNGFTCLRLKKANLVLGLLVLGKPWECPFIPANVFLPRGLCLEVHGQRSTTKTRAQWGKSMLLTTVVSTVWLDLVPHLPKYES